MSKRILFTTVILLFCMIGYGALAQESDISRAITVIATGSGRSLDEARNNALRQGVENACSHYVNSKINLKDSKVTYDETTLMVSGTVNSYEVISDIKTPDGTFNIIIKLFVNANKLPAFVQAQGMQVELRGGELAMEIKKQVFAENIEIGTINQLVKFLSKILQNTINYSIMSSEPRSVGSDSKIWELPLTVTARCNNNFEVCAKFLKETLVALSLPDSEITSYRSLNKRLYRIKLNVGSEQSEFNLRSKVAFDKIIELFSSWKFYIRRFRVYADNIPVYGTWESVGVHKDIYRNKIETVYDMINYNDSLAQITFLKEGKKVGEFQFVDKRNLSEVEKITEYKVIGDSLGKSSYILRLNDGRKLMMTTFDFGYLSYFQAKMACDMFVFDGYDDWYLPSLQEMSFVYNNKFNNMSWNFTNSSYWCNDRCEFGQKNWYFSFELGQPFYGHEIDTKQVRAFRVINEVPRNSRPN